MPHVFVIFGAQSDISLHDDPLYNSEYKTSNPVQRIQTYRAIPLDVFSAQFHDEMSGLRLLTGSRDRVVQESSRSDLSQMKVVGIPAGRV